MHASATTPRRKARGRAFRIAAAFAAAAITATTAACGAGVDIPKAQSQEPSEPEPLTQENVDAWLDEYLAPELDSQGFVGATVAVVGDGDVLTTRGYGHADLEADVEVDPEQSLFRIGSVSKVFTATAVMQLVEQGELDLDTDVSEYLDFEFEREYEDDLTLRHLLSHTAGFEERIGGLMDSGDASADLRDALVTDPPMQAYRPGTTPAYSNYGNSLAGYIVELVSGQPWEDYADEHLFEPLGLDSSTFRQPLPDGLGDRMSQGYAADSGPAEPFEVISMPPAGSVSATASDMARFMIEQMGLLGDDESLIGDQAREQMFDAALGSQSLGGLEEAPAMALGYFQEDRNGHRIVGHGGDTNQFHTQMQIYPDDGAGIYISINSNGNDSADDNALRMDLMHAFADRYFPAEEGAAVDTVDQETMRQNAEMMAGTYVPSRNFHSNFMSMVDLDSRFKFADLPDGRLLLEAHPMTGEPVVYEQVGQNLWQDIASKDQIGMRVEDGEVTAIVHDNAFSLLPMPADRMLALPVIIVSIAILVLGLLAWPAAAIYRKVRGRPAPDRAGRLWRGLVRVGAAFSLLALGGWLLVFSTLMDLQVVPDAAIRGVQALQLIGVLGMIPAVISIIVDIRRKAGWMPILATVLMLAALSGVANFAIEFQMLSTDISY